MNKDGEEESTHLFSAFDFSLSSHALIKDNLFSVASRASSASAQNYSQKNYVNFKFLIINIEEFPAKLKSVSTSSHRSLEILLLCFLWF